jgi:hypothetical protein
MGSSSSRRGASRGSLVGAPRPSVLWVPPYVSTTGPEALELAALAGLHADPWQAAIVRDMLGEREDGLWAAYEVGIEVPRQNGKGGILEIRELTGIFLLGELLVIHSAHRFDTSLEAFMRMLALVESCPDFDRRVLRVSRSHGEEGIDFRIDGRLARIRYRTRAKGGGRGLTGDLLVLDEAMNIPEGMHGDLLPTLSARPNAQVVYAGSAVDQDEMPDGIVFARIRKRGLAGGDPALMFVGYEAVDPTSGERFEHPADLDPETDGDPAVWASANPALGIRIREEVIAIERRSLSARKFAVERLCVGDWPNPDPETADRKISSAAWSACAERGSSAAGYVAFAVDMPPSRGSTVIAAAGYRADGRLHVEIVDHRSGSRWVPGRLVELVGRHRVLGVLIAKGGPAASLAPGLETAVEATTLPVQEKTGRRIRLVETADQAKAAGLLYDGVEQLAIAHLGTTELAAAVRGAETRPLGDAWLWSRSTSTVNISPLVAVTVALWGAVTIEPPVDDAIDVTRLRIIQF